MMFVYSTHTTVPKNKSHLICFKLVFVCISTIVHTQKSLLAIFSRQMAFRMNAYIYIYAYDLYLNKYLQYSLQSV